MTSEVKDDLRYGAVPWARFHHSCGSGGDVPALLEEVRLGDDEASGRALGRLWNRVCHQGGTSASGALAVPFLIRIALAYPRHRAALLRLVGAVARRPHFGDGSRAGLLRAGEPAGSIRIEPSGYQGTWSIEAARQAVAADANLLCFLLDDPEPAVRQAAAYALAAALPPPGDAPGALYARLAGESDPATRACVVLAIGQLAWEERDPTAVAQLREWWQAPSQPTDVRVSAALAWLCLVADPVPAELDTLLDTAVTDELTALLAPVPWLRDAQDGAKDNGLLVCLTQMRNPDDFPWLTGG
ncbi:HEAT repeat domain-containing protein [Kitasatospora sp. NPDC059408]|uniref:HEAT repeat domain-containing protein n=1 Tax=Kitasatospora sp. NPDC059408 TaxID=3346823 RepID=UPI003685DBD9